MKVLKNVSRKDAVSIFRGREINLPAKHSKILNEKDEEELALYRHLTQTFDFVIDISSRFVKGGE